MRDLGERYVVTVKGRRREYRDELRDCEKRAHTVAVFVALTLAPPDIAVPERPDVERAAAVAKSEASASADSKSAAVAESNDPVGERVAAAKERSTSVAEPRAASQAAALPGRAAASSAPSVAATERRSDSETTLFLALGATALAAPRARSSQSSVGAELRVSVQRGAWGLTLGTSIATPSTLELDSVPLRETRVPFDLSVRRGFRAARLQGAFELGPVAALTRWRQEALPNAAAVTRVELGARAAGLLGLDTAIAPYLSVFANIFPAPSELAAEPRGSIGHPSAVWLGASLGVSAKFP